MGQFSHAVVVPGEAPESDDELISASGRTNVFSSSEEISGNPIKTAHVRPKAASVDGLEFESLLHKKLYETNVALATLSKKLVNRQYTALAKDLNVLVNHGTNFRGTNEDTCSKMKSVAKDLYKIDDQLDAILKLNTLPEAIEVSDFPAIRKWSSERKNR